MSTVWLLGWVWMSFSLWWSRERLIAPWKGRRIMNRNQLANCCLFLAFYVNNTPFCIVWVFLYCFGDTLLGLCGTFLGVFFHKRVYRLGLTLLFFNTLFSYLVFIITILECVTCVTWWHVFSPISIFQFFFFQKIKK